jgi:hypothetical protein
MRDAYGTRFAVIVGLAYPGTADRPVYLFDIDASGFVTLVGAGVFDDVEQAGSAWSAMVGEAADEVRPERVTRSDELLCLVHVDLDQHVIRGDEPRTVMGNWFRANRRIHDLAAALDEPVTAGLSMPRATSLYNDVDSSVMTEPFTTWYTHVFDTEPDPEAVETLAGEWMEETIPETWFAVSPAPGRVPTPVDRGLDRRPDHRCGHGVAARLGPLARGAQRPARAPRGTGDLNGEAAVAQRRPEGDHPPALRRRRGNGPRPGREGRPSRAGTSGTWAAPGRASVRWARRSSR